MGTLVINILPLEHGGVEQDVVVVPTASGDTASVLSLNAAGEPFKDLLCEPAVPNVVKLCGDKLFESLYQNAGFSGTTLKPAVRTAIYFKLTSPATENLPWEALWHRQQNCFVALHESWPIARLAPAGQGEAITSTVEPELKLLIVLAAARGVGDAPVDASGEWREIWGALSTSVYADRLRVHVLYCQDQIRAALEALADPRISCEPVTSEQTLRQAVDTLQPNIVHFFCHGSSDERQPRIELAKPSDYDAEVPHGSIRLTSSDLTVLGRSHSVWLVTLNCCQGARSAGRLRSIAADVASNSVPAVIAMRESVDFRKANLFAGALYGHLVNTLGTYLPTEEEAAEGKEQDIPEDIWVNAMHPPRKALSNPAPEENPWWTLPVVYIQNGALKLKAKPRSTALVSLLPESTQDALRTLAVKGEMLRTVRDAMQKGGESAQATAKLTDAIDAARRDAETTERDALRALVKGPGLSQLQIRIATRRLAELDTRLA